MIVVSPGVMDGLPSTWGELTDFPIDTGFIAQFGFSAQYFKHEINSAAWIINVIPGQNEPSRGFSFF